MDMTNDDYMVDAATAVTTPVQEAAPTVQPKAPARRRAGAAAPGTGTAKRKPSKKVERVVFVKSRRKDAVARASVRKGTGIVRINGFDISTVEPIELRKLMLESLHVSNITEEFAKGVDISRQYYRLLERLQGIPGARPVFESPGDVGISGVRGRSDRPWEDCGKAGNDRHGHPYRQPRLLETGPGGEGRVSRGD